MITELRRAVCAIAICILFCGQFAFADNAPAAGVLVKYSEGKTELDGLKDGAKYFSNRNYLIQNLPAELNGVTFTRRGGGKPENVEISASAGTVVYLLLDSDKAVNANTDKLNKILASTGWSRLTDAEYLVRGKHPYIAVYKVAVSAPQSFSLSDGGWSGIVVAAKSLALNTGDPKAEKTQAPPKSTLRTDTDGDTAPIAGTAVKAAAQQATIKALEIYETDSGLMLGQTSEVTLTVERGDASKLVSVRFITPIGNEMSLARDEALRYLHLSYPNWYVDKAEITFEDKYVAHDGGSIGAAIGTMILSVIQGFQIDPDAAITGDISANGKIRAIGGVSAKLRGAVASKCTLAAIPMENHDQLVDAVIYSGMDVVSDIQVLGISTLDDAVATVRSDRSKSLTDAIALFGAVQASLKKSPDYLRSKDAVDKLTRVIALAPQHLSATVLLAIAQGTQPKTLSAAASRYYTFLAAGGMLDVLKERQTANNPHQLTSSVIRDGLADLRKLRPKADPKVRPLVDAWVKFISSWNDLQQGHTTAQAVESQRQALLDEMSKEQADPELMQKMLKEGM